MTASETRAAAEAALASFEAHLAAGRLAEARAALDEANRLFEAADRAEPVAFGHPGLLAGTVLR